MLKFIVFMIAAVAFAYYAYINFDEAFGTREPVACTEEVKICPDGSTVARSGPQCQFAVCPGE